MGCNTGLRRKNHRFDWRSPRRVGIRLMGKPAAKRTRQHWPHRPPPRFTACDAPFSRQTFTGSGKAFASNQEPTPTHFGARAAQKDTKPLPDEPGLRQKESARTVRGPAWVSGTAESIPNTRTRVEISRFRTRMSRLRDGISRTRVSKSPNRLFGTPASLIRTVSGCFDPRLPSPYPPPPHSRTSSPARASNPHLRRSAP